jgi:hypothetical protein
VLKADVYVKAVKFGSLGMFGNNFSSEKDRLREACPWKHDVLKGNVSISSFLPYFDINIVTGTGMHKVTWSLAYYTGRFIMFSVITNIYNNKTKGPTLMELFTVTRKLKKLFWQLEMFDVCTTGDTVHIDTIFISSCQKNFLSFPVAVNNPIKVGPLGSCYKCF